MISAGIVVVGSGRLARAILRTYPDRVIGLLVRDPASAGALPPCGSTVTRRVATSLDKFHPGEYGTIWIATSDAAIPSIAELLASQRTEWRGITVLHSSGATPLAAVDTLRSVGAVTAAAHPNAAFDGSRPIPSGLVWGVGPAQGRGFDRIRELLERLEPILVGIDDAARPLYHAGASAAANYALTLMEMARRLFQGGGMPERIASQVVADYASAASQSIRHSDPATMITGPIVRGDWRVVRAQLGSVEKFAPEYANLFRAFVLATAELIGKQEEWKNSEDL